MKYQNLFEQLKKTCNFIALEDEMFEIINAIKKDLINQGQELPIQTVVGTFFCQHKLVLDCKEQCHKCKKLPNS